MLMWEASFLVLLVVIDHENEFILDSGGHVFLIDDTCVSNEWVLAKIEAVVVVQCVPCFDLTAFRDGKMVHCFEIELHQLVCVRVSN